MTQADLSAVLNEHTKQEFATRDTKGTLRTMVDAMYVNHVPVMTGGTGKAALRLWSGGGARSVCHNRLVPLVLATAHLGDDQFLEAFHSCRLPTSEFRHADHLRLAWLHLAREPFEIALLRVSDGIRAFAKHHNRSGLYHETITTAWVHLLATHQECSFEEFLTVNEAGLRSNLLHRFWTPEILASREARSCWVTPDRQVLPARSR